MQNISENNYEVNNILKDTAKILDSVSKDKGLYVNYAKIYYSAIKFLQDLLGQKSMEFPININLIYEKLNIEIQKENLNEFMGDGDPQKVNRIIGKISIRPDYGQQGESKKSIYVDEKAAPAMRNYALAHELAHFILNYDKLRYTDEYCTMPMLPKMLDEVVADAFAVFLMIPFDMFLKIFKEYINSEKCKGKKITTEEWLSYLGSVAAVPYYYVTCAYQQIRHVAFLMYHIHMAEEEERAHYKDVYGEEVMGLYERIKDELDEETIRLLYQ